jgi:hypothetical protein
VSTGASREFVNVRTLAHFVGLELVPLRSSPQLGTRPRRPTSLPRGLLSPLARLTGASLLPISITRLLFCLSGPGLPASGSHTCFPP